MLAQGTLPQRHSKFHHSSRSSFRERNVFEEIGLVRSLKSRCSWSWATAIPIPWQSTWQQLKNPNVHDQPKFGEISRGTFNSNRVPTLTSGPKVQLRSYPIL